jgi:hypothetical protein
MNLKKKMASIQRDIAVPDQSDWQLLITSPEVCKKVIDKANHILVDTLLRAKACEMTWAEIRSTVYSQMEKLNRRYPKSGLLDSEGCATIATFFAIHYDPAIYDYLRYEHP